MVCSLLFFCPLPFHVSFYDHDGRGVVEADTGEHRSVSSGIEFLNRAAIVYGVEVTVAVEGEAAGAP